MTYCFMEDFIKRSFIVFLLAIIPLLSIGQFDSLLVEEVDNKGLVEGRTFRIYVVVKNEGDQVHAIFANGPNQLYFKSTKPFYQNKFGGGMASKVNRNLILEKEELAYDSWFTIGIPHSQRNKVNQFDIDLESFEAGKDMVIADGAWYVTPNDPQAYAKEDKKILIAQLTSEGEITGNINIQGRTGPNETDAYGNLMWETWKVVDVQFTCGGTN